jgi:biotin operon repressor
MNTNDKPPILEGCAVLPPMHQGNGSPRRHQGDTSKAKGKPSRRNTADRFAVLNAFVDAGMVGLSRVESLTWLVLYRDTRNGTACTSEDDIAKRIGCSKRAVVQAVGRLRRRGLLIQVFKGGINRGPSRYRVVPTPKPPRH